MLDYIRKRNATLYTRQYNDYVHMCYVKVDYTHERITDKLFKLYHNYVLRDVCKLGYHRLLLVLLSPCCCFSCVSLRCYDVFLPDLCLAIYLCFYLK